MCMWLLVSFALRFCTGCKIPCDDALFVASPGGFIGIDWDSTALHLRFQNSQDRVCWFVRCDFVCLLWPAGL